ncbi:neurogenic locus notch homolog protein 1-like [Pomacea canaliculata]|uniref:neurogenic locus notch homolog protein 1-like n=1 Tax=Pomacea canaliculata TaxID=400727 RepID=UPI000D73B9B4|nr:neurogenic locus notch homolog protein 1-like [Pomacea canaliculata]
MLIDPLTLSNGEACIDAGSGGERRCYTVTLVNDTNDPCAVNPCHNGGQCINTPPSYVCACPAQYAANANCDDQDTSSVDPPTSLTASGSYPGSVTATLRLPCQTRKENTPVNPDASQLNPHAVVPTLPSGLQITCDVGKTCQVPVYVNGDARAPLVVSRGPSSPKVVTAVSPPIKDNSTGIPLMTSLLSLTPQEAGDHHVCVDIVGSDVKAVDHVCYFIISRANGMNNNE